MAYPNTPPLWLQVPEPHDLVRKFGTAQSFSYKSNNSCSKRDAIIEESKGGKNTVYTLKDAT